VDNLPIKKPKKALAEVWSSLIPDDAEEGTVIELSIRITDQNIPVRDLSAFLEFVDQIYGRLSQEGLPSYSRRQHNKLEIAHIRKGSWELILEGAISRYHQQAELLVIIWLAVKYLPIAVKTGLSAYNDYEQARLAREKRKQIRNSMEVDEIISNLPTNRKKEITKLLHAIYEKEDRKLNRVSRFIRTHLIDVVIREKR
tara:strand:- start:1098 stop:1694 length:597 start_codon:yes stop_codon:yes gene_type:complete